MPEEYGSLKLKVPLKKGDGARAPQAFKDFADSITKPPTGAAKQIAIVQGTGALAFKEMKGDATLAEDGTLTIGNEKVESKHVKDGTLTPNDLAAAAKPFTWYAPSIIAAEQTRENTAYATLTTADEVKNVVLPANGLILVGYAATWKSSIAGAGAAAIFLGANQAKNVVALKGAPTAQAASTQGTPFSFLSTTAMGLSSATEEHGTSQVTTGQILGSATESLSPVGGLTVIFAEEGTYNISIRFKATSGNVAVKERKLWVATLGY